MAKSILNVICVLAIALLSTTAKANNKLPEGGSGPAPGGGSGGTGSAAAAAGSAKGAARGAEISNAARAQENRQKAQEARDVKYDSLKNRAKDGNGR